MRLFVLVGLVVLVGAFPKKHQASQLSQPSLDDLNQAGLKVLAQVPFFQNVPVEGQKEFLNIVWNFTAPRTKIELNLDAWAQKYQISNQWTTFKSQVEGQKTLLTDAVRTFLKDLPSVYEKIVQIDGDKTLSTDTAGKMIINELSTAGKNVGVAFQNYFHVIFGNSKSGDNQNDIQGNDGFPTILNGNGGLSNNAGYPGKLRFALLPIH